MQVGDEMSIEVEELPFHQVKENMPLPWRGEIQHAYTLSSQSEQTPLESIINTWTHYPVYICLEIVDSFMDQFESECTNHQLIYEPFGEFRDANYVILTIENKAAFEAITPFLQMLIKMETVVMWSTKRASFSWGDKEMKKHWFFRYPPITLHFEPNTTVFFPIECGISLVMLSNQPEFSSIRKIEDALSKK